jgi:hypothetical protein
MDQVWSSLMSEQLNTPPGAAEVYSDLSFITLQMVVGTIVLDEKLVTADSFLPQCQTATKVFDMNITSSRASTGTYEYDPVSTVCAFEAYVRQNVFHRPSGPDNAPWLPSSSYLPSPDLYPECAPTMDDTGL